MQYKTSKKNRQSIRLRNYDYSQQGAYFITNCTQNRRNLFGIIVDGKMILNDAGKMVQSVWNELSKRFDYIIMDECIIMPDHFHGIIVISQNSSCRGESCRGESCIRPNIHQNIFYSLDQNPIDQNPGDHEDRPNGRPKGTASGSLGRIIQAFKSISTNNYITNVKQLGWTPFPGKLWQRNYWEHIIRNEQEFNRIRNYIQMNPEKWRSED